MVNFIVIQFAPGGPVEQTIAKIQGVGIDATARISGSGSGDSVVNKNQSQSAVSLRVNNKTFYCKLL